MDNIRYNERSEKQAAAQQTFVAMHIEEAPVTRPLIFLGPLTKVQPANAGSRARKCEDLSLAFGLTAGGYTGNGTGRY